MKNLLLSLSLFLIIPFTGAFSHVKEAKGIQNIQIAIEDDALIAYSDDQNDPLKFIKVVNEMGQVVAEKRCSGFQCQANLSHLSSGTYLGIVYSLNDQYNEYFFLP